MVEGSSFHRLGHHIALKIRTLLLSFPLDMSTYHEIAPKIEFWIEYVLREQFTTVDELVEGVSYITWGPINSCLSVGRFLREFRDAPNRSEQARSFVDKLCEHILRWFAIVSVENLSPDECSDLVGNSKKGSSFRGAAWFVGRLIEQGLFSHEDVRRHLVKPLISHHYTVRDDLERSVRAIAIYNLFITARSPLLQGLLDPEDFQACFRALDAKISPKVGSPDPAKLKVHFPIYLHALCWLPADLWSGISGVPYCVVEATRGRTKECRRGSRASGRRGGCDSRRSPCRSWNSRRFRPSRSPCHDRYRYPSSHLPRYRAPLRVI